MGTGFLFSQVFALLFAIIGFAVVIAITARNRWRSPRAAQLIWIALGLKVISFLGGGLILFGMTRFSPTMIGAASAVVQLIQGVLGVTVLTLFARAAFVDRDDPVTAPGVSGSVPAGDENPYAAPR
ncbi:MAG: hypothetical protein AAFU85_15675 [Planctomycetota bacterium]